MDKKIANNIDKLNNCNDNKKENLKKNTFFNVLTRQHIIILFIIVAITFGAGVRYGQILSGNKEPVVFLSNEEEKSSDQINVFVSGAVVDEGIKTLKLGSKLEDLINTIELQDYADKDILNMSLVLSDKDVIYIPQKGEDLSSKNLDSNKYYGFNPNAIANSVDDTTTSSSSKSKNSSSAKKSAPKVININTANQSDFETLPGIGPSKAKAIITYRNQKGVFNSIEDITNVKGIGTKTFENIKQYLLI